MKTLLTSTLLAFPSLSVAATSISDLPKLAPLLVYETECRLAVFVDDEFEELYFIPKEGLSGHAAESYVVELTDDDVIASVNAHMIQINWSRNGQVVAGVQSMIQKSPTQGMVLIVIDPNNDDNQAHLSCHSTNYDQKRSRGSK